MLTKRIIKPVPAFTIRQDFMQRVENVIVKNLDNEDFCMADLQADLYMSSSQIYRKIKKETGYSPSVFTRNIRLQYACEYILRSDLSLSEIAYKVGFNGLSYFSKCFSRRYGLSPSSFRVQKIHFYQQL